MALPARMQLLVSVTHFIPTVLQLTIHQQGCMGLPLTQATGMAARETVGSINHAGPGLQVAGMQTRKCPFSRTQLPLATAVHLTKATASCPREALRWCSMFGSRNKFSCDGNRGTASEHVYASSAPALQVSAVNYSQCVVGKTQTHRLVEDATGGFSIGGCGSGVLEVQATRMGKALSVQQDSSMHLLVPYGCGGFRH